ncbi:hypothetical protein OCS_04585 [Ophiocordyceps sinensis CO18]|uniref:DUF1254 domain-containing protein n=1 Tax=Ophiocordyceps sinensis (strain Co18 / CGMCC 3.14243) TaxID=911162 RepID=T5ABC1_OPHSC|nr:hypothetical protein OCS_04585 [Ophiocordyceps sinensis CO18]
MLALVLAATSGLAAPADMSFRATTATAFAVTVSPLIPPSQGEPCRSQTWLLQYGYPLVQYAATVSPVLAFTGSNAVRHGRDLAAPDDVSLVRPDVDTLCSSVVVDLSHNDVSLTIPKLDDGGRYFVVAFHDVWSNNFVNLGSLGAAAPGKYLLRIADKPWDIGLSPVDGEEPSNYVGYIGFPTIYGLVAPRILVRDTAADLVAARNIQDMIKVDVVSRPGPRLGPRLTSELLGGGALEPLSRQPPGELHHDAVEHLLDVVARLDPFNRPANPVDGSAVTKALGEAGLANGEYDAPHGVDFSLASRLVNAALAETDKLLQTYSNGWRDLPAQYSGDFGNNYAVRASVALRGYGRLVQSEAIYPPSNWTSNWLPAPARGGEFSLTCEFGTALPFVSCFSWILILAPLNLVVRLVGPANEAISGEYVYPVVTKQKAIVGSLA